jgi:hypothetical protein
MKRDSEKIVSIGGWGSAGMMRYSCHCYNKLPIAALQNAPTPMPNQTPNLVSCQALSTHRQLLKIKPEF